MTIFSVDPSLSHNEPLDTHETTPAQVLVDNRQELAAQAYDRPKESEWKTSMSLAPAGSPDSSLSSASIPDYLLEKSPNLQVDEKKEEEIDWNNNLN